MQLTYSFNHNQSYVDICREEYHPTFNSHMNSFTLDDKVRAISLKQEVLRNGDINDTKIVKVALIIIKDKDCRDFLKQEQHYNKWKYGKEAGLANIHIDKKSSEKLSAMYEEEYAKAVKQLNDNIIYKYEFDYSMPAGQSEEMVTVSVPINKNWIAEDTLYRIGIIDCGSSPTFCHEWAAFDFFSPEISINEMIKPTTAFVRVRKPDANGKTNFEHAADYRHYKDFFNDIHYDKTCMEVEVNPALVCIEFDTNPNISSLPFFHIRLQYDDNELYDLCNIHYSDERKKIILYCPLPAERILSENVHEITASVDVLGSTIASFTFSTDKTEPGRHTFATLTL